MNFNKNAEQAHPGFQIAPMIDVVFLLLIFFMVASVYAQWETKLNIQVPTADTAIQTPRQISEIIINLDAKGRIYINNREFKASDLEQLLKTIALTFKGQPVIIRADRHTDYEAVIQVLDTCRKADIWNVSFATLTPKSGKKAKEGATAHP